MLEVTIDLNWADERYQFVKEVAVHTWKGYDEIVLTLSSDAKISGHPDRLREFAAQIIAACDAHYPLETAAAS